MVNPDGQVSNPVTVTVWAPNVVAAQTVNIDPGQSGIYLSDGNEHGFTGYVNNQGSEPLSVTLAIYSQNPTARPLTDFGAGYGGLKISGAGASDSAHVVFDYPAGSFEANLYHLRSR